MMITVFLNYSRAHMFYYVHVTRGAITCASKKFENFTMSPNGARIQKVHRMNGDYTAITPSNYYTLGPTFIFRRRV